VIPNAPILHLPRVTESRGAVVRHCDCRRLTGLATAASPCAGGGGGVRGTHGIFGALCHSVVGSESFHVLQRRAGMARCKNGEQGLCSLCSSAGARTSSFCDKSTVLAGSGVGVYERLCYGGRGVFQVSVPVMGPYFSEVVVDLFSARQSDLLCMSFFLGKNHPKKTIPGHRRKLCLTIPPPPRHVRLHGSIALFYCVSSPPS